jgi:uncharacterized protein YjbI with pentapeptide repeats
MEKRMRNALITNNTDGSVKVQEQLESQWMDQVPAALQSSAIDDCDTWRGYWWARNQPWRTEQEIEAQRQVELARCSATIPDIEQGRYPFRDIKLSRADVEWMLAANENSPRAVGWQQRTHEGLDLRGADLRKARLAGLPLMCMRGGLSAGVWLLATDIQREAAAVRLERADLRGAHLEGADLCGAHLEEADLCGAHLEGADLRGAHLAGSNLCEAHLEGANLSEACMGGNKHVPKPANLRRAFFDSTTNLERISLGDEKYGAAPLADVHWGNVNLAVVDWTQLSKLGDEYETQWKLPVEYQGAIRANRQLAAALRAQGLKEAADHFAYRAHVNQRLMRPQQALFPIVLRMVVRERMPLPKVLLRLEERRQGQRAPRHPLALALMRLSPLLLAFSLIALLKPLVLAMLLVVCIASFLSVLPAMRKRKRHAPKYRRAQRQLPPPGLLSQRQRRRQQWLLLLGFVVGTPKSKRPLLLKPPAVALQQVPLVQRLWVRFGGRALLLSVVSSLLLLLLLFDDALVCYGRYTVSLSIDVLTGYGYRPARSLFWFVVFVLGFSPLYFVYGHLPSPEALVFSLFAFLGRGFFPGSYSGLANQAGVLAAIEAGIGVVIELSFIASWIQRLCER